MRQLYLTILALIAIAAVSNTTTLKNYVLEKTKIEIPPKTKDATMEQSDAETGKHDGCQCKCKCCLQKTLSCDSYCVCIQGKTSSQNKCIGGLKFNAAIENCDFPSSFTCETWQPLPSNFRCRSEEDRLYYFPGNCSLFVQCGPLMIANVHQCPMGLHFCETCQKCTYSSVAKCTAESGTKKLASRLPTTPKSEETTSRVVKRNVSMFPCPKKFGFFPILGRVNAFYKCIDGFSTEEHQCPTGLVFNPTVSACSKL